MTNRRKRLRKTLIGNVVAWALLGFTAQIFVSAAGAASARAEATSKTGVGPGAGRTLHFPKDRSLGSLYVQDANAKREDTNEL